MSCLAFTDPTFAAVCLTCDARFGTGHEELARNHENNKEDHSVYICDCTITEDNKVEPFLPCAQAECIACALINTGCQEPLHWHHDGCPACSDY